MNGDKLDLTDIEIGDVKLDLINSNSENVQKRNDIQKTPAVQVQDAHKTYSNKNGNSIVLNGLNMKVPENSM